MADRWYYRSNGKAEGPLTSVELRQLVSSGAITSETPLRRGADGTWRRADQVPGLFADSGTVAAAATPRAAPVAVAAKPSPAKPKPLAAPAPSKPAATARAAAPPPKAAPAVKPAPAKVVAVAAVAPAVAKVAATPAPRNAPSATTPVRNQRKQSGALPLIITGVVVGLFLACVGVAAIVLISRASLVADSEQPATTVEPTTDAAAADDSASTAEGEAAEEIAEESSEEPAAETEDADVPADPAARQAAIAAIKSWPPAVNEHGAGKQLKSSKAQIELNQVWVGSDAQRDVSGPGTATSSGDAKYLFVRVSIANRQPNQPLSYSGWNSAGLKKQALLQDDNGEFLELAPANVAASSRLSDVEIAPGQKATDVLVFELARPEFKRLRLALPYPGAGHFGFTIEPTMLASADGDSTGASETVDDPAGENPIVGAVPADEPPAAGEPATATGEAPPTEDGDDVEDLQRSINETAGAPGEVP